MEDLSNEEFASSFILTLKYRTPSETYKMLRNGYCEDTINKHKLLNYIHMSKVAALQTKTLKIHVTHHYLKTDKSVSSHPQGQAAHDYACNTLHTTGL
jgi:hypothetical protein